MTNEEWGIFFAGVKERSAKLRAELKARPDVTTCDKCDSPQLPGHKCTRCGGQACYEYGDLDCLCWDIEATEYLKANPL